MKCNNSTANHSFVSVIIPVFNDVHRLKICLEALELQTYPRQLYQVIVVDNGSDRDLNLAGIVDQFSQAIYTFEDTPGSYAARNHGLSIANGNIIAFTDADCIPSPSWIEAGVEDLISAENCGLVAGKIEVFFKDSNRPNAIELYEYLTAFPQREFIEKYHFGVTANIFTFQEIFEKVGRFNAILKSGGDFEWTQRVYANGYQLLYSDAAWIQHPARHSFWELYLRTIRISGGQYDLAKRKEFSPMNPNFSVPKLLKNFIHTMTPPVAPMVNMWADTRLNSLNQRIKVSMIIMFVYYVREWEKLRLRCGGISSRY